jgi:hypothetical protein
MLSRKNPDKPNLPKQSQNQKINKFLGINNQNVASQF